MSGDKLKLLRQRLEHLRRDVDNTERALRRAETGYLEETYPEPQFVGTIRRYASYIGRVKWRIDFTLPDGRPCAVMAGTVAEAASLAQHSIDSAEELANVRLPLLK